MKTITVTRKKKFASAMMPYWIIVGVSKADFCAQHGLVGDACEQSESGFPVARIDMKILDEVGTRIGNGETVQIEIKEDDVTLFVSTVDGYLSNEVRIKNYENNGMKLTVTTKGGFENLPHPVVVAASEVQAP